MILIVAHGPPLTFLTFGKLDILDTVVNLSLFLSLSLTANLMYMEPGLKMWVEDVEGLQHVGFHFNINEELNGIDFGQENVEIDKVSPLPTAGIKI